MGRISKSFRRIGQMLGLTGNGAKRRARGALHRAVMETLEQRQLMDGALELFWVQTGGASGLGPGTPNLTYSNLTYEHHWVVAHSPQEAAYTLLNANTASATLTVGFTFSHYTTTTYNVGTASTDFWIIGTSDEVSQGYNNTGSSSAQALVAYGGYLDANTGYGANEYEITTPVFAPGIPNFCLPCNGIINPGPGLVDLPTSVTMTGQSQVLNDTPGGTNLASVLSTPVWGTGDPMASPVVPDQTVAQLMGGGSSGSTDDLQLINGDPYHGGSNSQYMAVYCGSYLEIFQGSGGVYTTTMGGSQDTLVYSGGGFVLTDADGTVFNFGGSSDSNGVGSGDTSSTDPAGNTTTVSHDANGRVTQKQTPTGTNSLERTVNTYDTGSGMLATVVVNPLPPDPLRAPMTNQNAYQ